MLIVIDRTLRASAGFALAGVLAVTAMPDPASGQVFDGDLMVGNARGGSLYPGPNMRPTVLDGYTVSGLSTGDVVTMEFAGTTIRVHATQSGLQIPDCGLNSITLVAPASGTVTFFPATVGQNNSPVANVTISVNSVPMQVIRYRSLDLFCNPNPGEAGRINGFDLNEFRQRFLGFAGHSPFDPDCDFATEGPSAGIVDTWDFNVFRADFLCGATMFLPMGSVCEQTQCVPCP